jgi:hypothetical protein
MSLPASMKVSEFMLQLSKQLIETKKVAESTASAYVKSLYLLNGKVPFKNLSFLKKTADIEAKIAPYAENTQKALYSTITSVLSLVKDTAGYKKVYQHYYDKMMGKATQMKEAGAESSTKTEKQKDNWAEWKDVEAVQKHLIDEVEKFSGNKNITPEQFNSLLNLVVLSLYTEIQPRRNQDYLDMSVVKATKADLPKDSNYLIIEKNSPKEFVFNKYKTAKKYGQQKMELTPGLVSVLSTYLKFHPLARGNKSRATMYKFLVLADGTPLTATNAITRILNRIFGKKIGSSMLRHIFLSSKYNINEMEKDATAMGHSVEEQQKYLRGSGTVETPVLG